MMQHTLLNIKTSFMTAFLFSQQNLLLGISNIHYDIVRIRFVSNKCNFFKIYQFQMMKYKKEGQQ